MLILLLVIAGITSDADAKLSLALATSDGPPPVVPTGPPSVPQPPPAVPTVKVLPPVPLDFWAAVDVAVKQRQPVVMFLGIGKSRQIVGAVVGQQDYVAAGTAHADYPSIIVGAPDNGWIVWHAKLPKTASDADIRAALGQRVVQPAASPFEQPSPAGRDDSLERGPWPATLEFPTGMVRYRRARNTQSIFVLGVSDRIQPVPRAQLEGHWQVSGGMQGLSGWRSDVYRNDMRPQTWVANIHVWNGSNFQANRGYVRRYPDGAKFMDVLSTDKGVFEVRQRLKVGGQWDSDILYEDPAARPIGYSGKTQRSCASCHAEAGSGAYGVGLVSGGDGVISDPFEALER